MRDGMKNQIETTYVFSEADAVRLKSLARTLSIAIAELLNARCQESLKCAPFEDEIDRKELADFDLYEIMTYEQSYELRQSLSGDETD